MYQNTTKLAAKTLLCLYHEKVLTPLPLLLMVVSFVCLDTLLYINQSFYHVLPKMKSLFGYIILSHIT